MGYHPNFFFNCRCEMVQYGAFWAKLIDNVKFLIQIGKEMRICPTGDSEGTLVSLLERQMGGGGVKMHILKQKVEQGEFFEGLYPLFWVSIW